LGGTRLIEWGSTDGSFMTASCTTGFFPNEIWKQPRYQSQTFSRTKGKWGEGQVWQTILRRSPCF